MTTLDRAYSVLNIKAVDEGGRIVRGTATTPRPDRVGDIVESAGATFRLPLPLLLDHDHRRAVGEVIEAKQTAKGISFVAKIAQIDTPGPAKALVDEAWDLVRAGLRRCVSIGFRPLKHEPMAAGGVRFLAWEWIELSLVAVPANIDAVLQNAKSGAALERVLSEVRSIDRAQRQATPRLEWEPFGAGILDAASARTEEAIGAVVAGLDAMARKAGSPPLSGAEMERAKIAATGREAMTLTLALRHHEHAARMALGERLDALTARLDALEAQR